MPKRTQRINPTGHLLGTARAPVAEPGLRELCRSLPTQLVYFMRIKGLIKIGYTTDLYQRRQRLGAEWSDVLAIMAGDVALEAALLDRFENFAVVGREWFMPHTELYDLVDEIRAGYRLPPVDRTS